MLTHPSDRPLACTGPPTAPGRVCYGMRAVQGDQLEQGRRDEARVGQREERREAMGARQLLLVDTRGGHGCGGGAYPVQGKILPFKTNTTLRSHVWWSLRLFECPPDMTMPTLRDADKLRRMWSLAIVGEVHLGGAEPRQLGLHREEP